MILAFLRIWAHTPPLARLAEYPEGSPNSFAKIQQISHLSSLFAKKIKISLTGESIDSILARRFLHIVV